MDEAKNIANNAFEKLQTQEYKGCIEHLNKLKSNSNEKEAYHVRQNLYIAEFMGAKSSVNNLLTKLEELYSEVKSQNAPSIKVESSKVSGELDEDITSSSSTDLDDGGVLKYNYAVALQLAGKKNQSLPLLEELFQNKDTVDDYILLKASLTYLDIAIIQKDYALIKTITEFLETVKKYIGIPRDKPLNLQSELDEGTESTQSESASEVSNVEGTEKENRIYNSLIFGSEIYKHGASPIGICKLEISFILTIYQINILLSLKENELAKKKLNTAKNLFFNLTKMIKDGKDEKGNTNARYAPEVSPYLDRHVNVLYNFSRAYLAYQTLAYSECLKLLNTIEILTFYDEEIIGYTALQLNNLGCCHLRLKKYSLAAYYLSKSLSIIQKLSKENSSETKKYERILNLNAIQQYPMVLHNYALATLQMGKWDEAAEAYSSLAEFWPDNAKIWYRVAICHLNKSQELLSENQNQRKNGIYQSLIDLPNYTQLVEEEKAEQTKSKKTEDIEHKENPYYTRYTLESKDNTLQRSEEELTAQTGPKFISQNPDINKGNEGTSSSLTDKQLKMHLEKTIRCFRNAVLVAKKKKTKQQKEPQTQLTFSYLERNEGDDEVKAPNTENEFGEEEEKEKSFTVKSTKSLKENQDILQSSLAYLAYTSLSLGEINNTINFAKECLELPYITDDNKYICLMYLVEAYCFLGNQKEALNQMNSANVTQTILTVARNALGINQAHFVKNLSSKVVIYTNLATAHILNNNLTGAQNAINIALSNIDPALLQIPISLLNLMIYLNLRLEKPETALQILKRRRILNTGNNKILLRIVKWMN